MCFLSVVFLLVGCFYFPWRTITLKELFIYMSIIYLAAGISLGFVGLQLKFHEQKHTCEQK